MTEDRAKALDKLASALAATDVKAALDRLLKEPEMDLKKLQEEVNRRWDLQINNPCHRSADASHALVHMTKALGKIASALNDAEHENRAPTAMEVENYLADLVICAARFGYGIVDLDAACVARLAEKFPVVETRKTVSVTVDDRGEHWK